MNSSSSTMNGMAAATLFGPPIPPHLAARRLVAGAMRKGFKPEALQNRSSPKTSRWRRSTQAVAGPDSVPMARSTSTSSITSAEVYRRANG